MKKQRLEDFIIGTTGVSAIKGAISGKGILVKIFNAVITPAKDIYRILDEYYKTSDYKVSQTKKGKTLKIVNKKYLIEKIGTKPIINGLTKASITHISKDALEGKMTIGPITSKYYTAAIYTKLDSTTNKYKYNTWKYLGSSTKP